MAVSLSTHVLDTERGRPGSGVKVELRRGDEVVASSETDGDGRAVRRVEDQAPLLGRARRGDAGHFQASQLNHGPTLRPQSRDVVRRIACLCHLQQ